MTRNARFRCFLFAAFSLMACERRSQTAPSFHASVAAPVDLARLGFSVLASPLGGGGLDAPSMAGAPDAQIDPAVAFDGSIYLVVWSDHRSHEASEVYGARVALDGTLLDPVGFPIATGPGERGSVAVAAGGDVFLVTWRERATSHRGFRAVRVSSQGQILDAEPIEAGAQDVTASPSALAFDGTEFRAVWARQGYSDDRCPLFQTRISQKGEMLESGQYVAEPGCSQRIALACSDQLCLAATGAPFPTWDPTVEVLLFDRTSSAVSSFSIAGAGVPAADYDGSKFFLVWQDDRLETGHSDIYGMRIDPGGEILDRGGLPIAIGGDRSSPVVAFDGAHHLVIWEEQGGAGSDLLGMRVSLEGNLLDSTYLSLAAVPGAQRTPALAASPVGALVAFGDTRNDLAGDVYAARIGAAAEVQDPEGLLVSASGNREAMPSIAFDGTSWLVVWEDSGTSGGGSSGIYRARVAADGTVLEPAAPLALDGAAGVTTPAVAGCGNGWVVAWEDRRSGVPQVFTARLSAAGDVLRAAAAAPGTVQQTSPALACDAGRALVVWQQEQVSNGYGALAATRLDSGGTALDGAGLALSSNTAWGTPAVAAGPAGFTVLWQGRSGSSGSTILATRIPSDGAAGAVVTLCSDPGIGGQPAIAFDGAGFQAAFQDAQTSPGRIRSARLSADGKVVDVCGVPLSGSVAGLGPRIAFGGDRSLAVWRDSATGDLMAAQLTPGGGVIDVQSIVPGSEHPRSQSVSCDPQGRCLVAYQRWDAASGIGRISVRAVTLPAQAARCMGSSDCASGYGVDGVCCDTACGGGDPTDCLACSVAAGAPVDGTCAPVVAGQLCQEGGACDLAERCDGASRSCPADVLAPDGAWCDDGNACTRADTCSAGVCKGSDPVQCSGYLWEKCEPYACNPRTGFCEMAPLPDGTRCDDGNPCTVEDACAASDYDTSCRGKPKSCPASDSCHIGSCDASTGECKQEPMRDGYSCDDGSACTTGDHCQAGACVAVPKSCPAPDDCHLAGLCDRTTGECVYAKAPDGTHCDDGNACTHQDACSAGLCKGTAVVCTAPDDCHSPGVCDSGTGTCSAPVARPDGATCDDGNGCTDGDQCRAGACVPGQPVVCSPGPCTEVGVCDPGTGSCSAGVAKPDGTSCEDGSHCTIGDACRGGACQPGTTVTCQASASVCHVATCDPATGGCLEGLAPDGAACPGGTCQAGECKAAKKEGGGCEHGAAGDWALLLAVMGMAVVRLRRGAANPP